MITEEQMIAVWQKIFSFADVKSDSDFFDLGGNSLDAIQLIEVVERDFGVVLPVTAIFDEGSPSGLCRLLRKQ